MTRQTETIETPLNCGVIIVEPKDNTDRDSVYKADDMTSTIVNNILDNYKGDLTIYRL